MSEESYIVSCWNCLGEFDAMTEVWCSDDPRNPTKLCPFCLQCFCSASVEYKTNFWRNAPSRLQEEFQALTHSNDRIGDILIRMKKITTPQLLEVLMEQKQTRKKLGELLVERGIVQSADIEAALKSQGIQPLSDTHGVAYAAQPVWDQGGPDAIIQYVLSLAARRGASDVHLEPKEDSISVKYRIDGFSFRVDPIPKDYQPHIISHLFEIFRLNILEEGTPQRSRVAMRLNETDFDVIVQTLPTPHGVSATVKLVNRSTFIKDFTTLGLEIEDRVHIMESLRAPFGLILVSAPSFHGAATTGYAIMNFLGHAQRDVVTLEAPLFWHMDGIRQVEVELNGMEQALRSAIAVRPEVVMLSAIPNAATAQLVVQLATSLLVVALVHAQSASQAITMMVGLGTPVAMLTDSLLTVICQRLVRRICPICRAEVDPPAAQTLALHGIDAVTAQNLKFFRGKGCPSCHKVGYRGRKAIFELLAASPEIRGAVLDGLTPDEIETLATGGGMKALRDRCLDLVREGITTFDEFARLRF